MHGEGIFEVRATAGDTHLGVEDFDNAHMPRIVKLVSDFFSSHHQCMGKVSLRSRQPPVTLTWVLSTLTTVSLTTSYSSAHIPHIVKLVSDFFNSEECNKCTFGTKYVCFFYFHPFLLLTGGIQCYTHPPVRLRPLAHNYVLNDRELFLSKSSRPAKWQACSSPQAGWTPYVTQTIPLSRTLYKP
jgi:hypothetical protein